MKKREKEEEKQLQNKKMRRVPYFIIALMFLLIIIGIFLVFILIERSNKTKKIEIFINETEVMENGQCTGKLTYKSDDSTIISVDENGKLFALKEGETEIVSKNSKNKICMIYKVKVKEKQQPTEITAIDEIKISDTLTLNENEVVDLEYSLVPKTANEKIYFISNDESVVSISSSGKIKGISNGETTIALMTESGYIFEIINVVVKADDSEEEISTEQQRLKITDSLLILDMPKEYKIEYVYANSDEELIWESSNPEIISVKNGNITASSYGTAIVTVKNKDGLSSSVVIHNVDNGNIKKVTFNEEKIYLNIGNEYEAQVYTTPVSVKKSDLQWSSSNLNIATVNEQGMIKAVAKGIAQITVKSSNGKTDILEVAVTENKIDIEEIKISISEPVLYVGEQKKLSYNLRPTGATNSEITWTSTNPKVASVNQVGVITALNTGTTEIQATVGGIKSEKIEIEVKKISEFSKNDMLKTSGMSIVKNSGESMVLRGVNLGIWLSRSYWALPIYSGNNSDDSKRISDVNNIQMHYEMFTNVNLINYASNNNLSIYDVIDNLNDMYYKNYITTEDLDIIAETGANVVRVPLEYSFFGDIRFNVDENNSYKYTYSFTPFDFDSDEFNDRFYYLEWIVDECSKRGIYVIFDIHVAEGGLNAGGYRDNPTFFVNSEEGEKNREAVIKLWTEIAKRFDGNPGVAGYDLVNEPGEFEDGDPSHKVKKEDIIEFYDQAYDAIRKVNKDHIIIMEAPWVSGSNSISNLPDPADYDWKNVVYSTHDYFWDNAGEKMSDKYRPSESVLKTRIETKTTESVKTAKEMKNSDGSKGVPIFIGEFNPLSIYSNDTDKDNNWNYSMDLYDKNGISYTAWTYKSGWDHYMGIMYYGRSGIVAVKTNSENENNKVRLDKDSYERISTLFSSTSKDVMKYGNTYNKYLKNQFNGNYGNVVFGTNSIYTCEAGEKIVATVKAVSKDGKAKISNIQITKGNEYAALNTNYKSKTKLCSSCKAFEIECKSNGNVEIKATSTTGVTETAKIMIAKKTQSQKGTISFDNNKNSYSCTTGQVIYVALKSNLGDIATYKSSNSNYVKVLVDTSNKAGCTNSKCTSLKLVCIKNSTNLKNPITITATSTTGAKTEAKINVKEDIGTISFGTKSSYSCSAGEKKTATVIVTSNDGSINLDKIKSSNVNVANVVRHPTLSSVKKDGTVTVPIQINCLKAGTTNLTATSTKNQTITTKVNVVNPKVEIMSFGTNSKYTCEVGEKITATINISSPNGKASVNSYISTNKNIATIIKHPKVVAQCPGCAVVQISCLKEGITTLTATSSTGKSKASAIVEVSPKDIGTIKFGTNSSYKCEAGKKITATIRTTSNDGTAVTQKYSSQDPTIATIKAHPTLAISKEKTTEVVPVQISCLKTGIVSLTATSSKGATTKVNVEVSAPSDEVIDYGTKSSYKCSVGEKLTATITLESSDSNVSVISYTSKNKSIATINGHPTLSITKENKKQTIPVQIECLKVGTTTLTATSSNKVTTTAEVIVSAK